MSLLSTLANIIIFVISSLPLHFAVKFLGGKTKLIKTVIVNAIVGVAVSAVNDFFGFLGGFLAFLTSVYIYREMFRLKWPKAFIVWLIQFLIIGFLILLIVVFGIAAIFL